MIKKVLFLVVISLSCAVLFSPIHSGYVIASEEDSSKGKNECISLGNQGIKDVLMKLKAPDAKVLSITDSPVKGLCEIAIENMGRSQVFYLSLDKKFLVFGSLVEVATMSNKTQESIKGFQDKKRIDIAKIPLDGALILGEGGASKKVIVFTDPDCPYCSQLHQPLNRLSRKGKT